MHIEIFFVKLLFKPIGRSTQSTILELNAICKRKSPFPVQKNAIVFMENAITQVLNQKFKQSGFKFLFINFI